MRGSAVVLVLSGYLGLGALIQHLVLDYSIGIGWRLLVMVAWPLLVLGK